jgi:hypothetical protein
LHGLLFQKGDAEGGFVPEFGVFEVRHGEFCAVEGMDKRRILSYPAPQLQTAQGACGILADVDVGIS